MSYLRPLLELVLFLGTTFCLWVLVRHLTDTSKLKQEGDDDGEN